jgi:enoyl-CoA hydratase
MSEVEVVLDEDRKIAEVYLNRPEKLNALNDSMLATLQAELYRLADSDSVSSIILAGRGRAFSAGHDLAGLTGEAHESRTVLDNWRLQVEELQDFVALRRLRIPVVAAVHGYCFGAATLLVSCCADITVVAEDLRWGAAKPRVGAGFTGPTLSLLIGDRKAREIEYRNGELTGSEAAAIGWANYAVPKDEVLSRARSIAADISMTPREILEIRKEAMNRALELRHFQDTVRSAAVWDPISHYSASGELGIKKVGEIGFQKALESWKS